MKKITCKDLGGPCDHAMTAETAEDAAKQGYGHIASTQDEAHQKLKGMVDVATDEEKQKWMEGFEKTFSSAPDA